jgi:hypothetical protein
VCDTALVYGFGAEARPIDRDLVEDVIRDKTRYGVFTVAA